MMIKRQLEQNIEKWLFKGKIIIIYGPRQVGKTTLSKKLIEKYGDKSSYINCDDIHNKQQLEIHNAEHLKKFLGGGKFFVFDEAQRVKNIGLTLKLIIDTFPDIQVVATGSSSFDLSNKINEPLTGRALEFILYPFSYSELSAAFSLRNTRASLDHLLRFGSYPTVVNKTEHEAVVLLQNLASQYLYKDVFEFEDIRKPDLLLKMLQLVAFQIGQEVSIHELAVKWGVSTKLVSKYIELLEKAFVIFRLGALSRNPRNEIGKKKKIYFYDIGIRNILIQRTIPLEIRDDVGFLWENFCVIERKKKLQYEEKFANQYFWRSKYGAEVDYAEEFESKITGYEFKWSKEKTRTPELFAKNYKATVNTITKDNFDEFVM